MKDSNLPDKTKKQQHYLVLRFIFIGLICLLVPFNSSTVKALDGEAQYCVYTKKGFKGKILCGSEGQVSWLSKKWFQKISSVEIQDGYEMLAYRYPWYFGEQIILSGNVNKLDRGWNNKIGSFKLQPKPEMQNEVCFYSGRNYRGRSYCTNNNQRWVGWSWYRRVSSISIPEGKEVTLFPYWFFGGTGTTHTENIPRLSAKAKRIGSFQINDLTADSDGDGVLDNDDLCPSTPIDESVGEDGCSLSQLDTDSDGINDLLDLCPNTNEGAIVDSDGCAPYQRDSDNDGVNDADDLCPNTPQGDAVDSEGCGASQLDDDNDGVTDGNDLCTNTEAGDIVNSDGCSLSQLDTDEDGINDAVDQCQQTPINEFVNIDGCGFSQLDTDNDGVVDDIDQCPATAQSVTVDATGCSNEQIINESSIVLITPQVTDNVSAGKVIVSGTVDWQGELGVSINGQAAMIDNSVSPVKFSTLLEVPEGETQIQVLATNVYGKSATLSRLITAGPREEIIAELYDEQGFSPFTAELSFSTETELRIISIEIDFDDDGTFDISQQAEVGNYLDIDQVFEHTYLSAGISEITTRVQDENGQYYDQKSAVNVVNKEQLKSQLVGIWDSMNNAIIGGDVKLGLSLLSNEAAPQYQRALQALQPNFVDVVSEYSSMDCEDVALTFASCAVVRMNSDTGNRTLHFINYGKNGNGLWKISGL